ncbi:MAG: alpha/beta hydrolase [Casimicrobiaceae bacterium]
MDIRVNGSIVHAYTGSRAPDESLPSVVFVHGAAHDHSVWALQSRYFAWHGCNALAIDLPGHGRSDGAPLPTIEAIADWIAELVATAARGSATLVGHSMGALAVLECAARHPAVVERVALLGPAVPMAVSDVLLAAARDNAQLAYEMINAWSFSARAVLGGNPAPGMSMSGSAMRLMQRASAGTLHTDLLACQRYVRGIEAASEAMAPALVILGGRDLMAPGRQAASLLSALREPSVVTFDAAGHALMAEQPAGVLDALTAFVPH